MGALVTRVPGAKILPSDVQTLAAYPPALGIALWMALHCTLGFGLSMWVLYRCEMRSRRSFMKLIVGRPWLRCASLVVIDHRFASHGSPGNAAGLGMHVCIPLRTRLRMLLVCGWMLCHRSGETATRNLIPALAPAMVFVPAIIVALFYFPAASSFLI